MDIETVAPGGREMDCLRFGKGGGDKLVVLPGLSLRSVLGSADAIASAYAPLAEDHDIYLLDHVHEEPEGYGIGDMADDALGAFDALGIERAHVMGVSLGGMVAQEIALKAPERVSSLVLTSTAARADASCRAALAEWEALAKRKDAAALMASFAERVYTPSFYDRNREAILTVGEGATELDFRNFIASAKAAAGFDAIGGVGGITCPALVIGAVDDRIFGAQAARDLAEALGCGLYVYEGYGHAVYDEAPDYLAHVGSFLREARRQGATSSATMG